MKKILVFSSLLFGSTSAFCATTPVPTQHQMDVGMAQRDAKAAVDMRTRAIALAKHVNRSRVNRLALKVAKLADQQEAWARMIETTETQHFDHIADYELEARDNTSKAERKELLRRAGLDTFGARMADKLRVREGIDLPSNAAANRFWLGVAMSKLNEVGNPQNLLTYSKETNTYAPFYLK
jgi:hypothetical protein